MRYCLAKRDEKNLDKAYRIYVTDALRLITENTAKSANGGGSYYKMRFAEIIEPPKAETRTSDEIISSILDGLSKL